MIDNTTNHEQGPVLPTPYQRRISILSEAGRTIGQPTETEIQQPIITPAPEVSVTPSVDLDPDVVRQTVQQALDEAA